MCGSNLGKWACEAILFLNGQKMREKNVIQNITKLKWQKKGELSHTAHTTPSLPYYQNKLIKNLLMDCAIGVLGEWEINSSSYINKYQRDPWTVEQIDDTAKEDGKKNTHTSIIQIPVWVCMWTVQKGKKTSDSLKTNWDTHCHFLREVPSAYLRTDGSTSLLCASVLKDNWSPNILHLRAETFWLSVKT